jgi:hypothetical protein
MFVGCLGGVVFATLTIVTRRRWIGIVSEFWLSITFIAWGLLETDDFLHKDFLAVGFFGIASTIVTGFIWRPKYLAERDAKFYID